MKARIRAKLLAQNTTPTSSSGADIPNVVPVDEEYYTPQQVADRLKLHPDTVKALFRNETNGVIRIGNRVSSKYKKRYVKERYSASAVERLIRKLELEDPRYAK
jgi:hypothetical protein